MARGSMGRRSRAPGLAARDDRNRNGRRGEIASVALVSEHASPLAQPGGPDAGGQNVYVAALAAELARRGISTTVFTRRDSRALPPRAPLTHGATLEHLDAGPPEPLSRDALAPYMSVFARELETAWRREPPDVVHAHYWMSGLAAARAARGRGIPIVQTFHALGVVKRRVQGKVDTSPAERIAAETHLARTVDAVAATSYGELRQLALMGAVPRRSGVIPCGVDTRLFCPDGPTEPRMGRRRLVAVGRLVPRKGVDDVVRALRHLPGIELIVAGGRAGVDADRERLRALAHAVGVGDRVELRGPVLHASLPRLMRSADLVVCVPWYEPFGIVALEAMACGRPVVASAVDGLVETIVDGRTGVLVPPRNSRMLAQTVGALLADDEQRHRLGDEARRRVERDYDWRRVIDLMLELYAEARARRPRPARGDGSA